MIIHNNMIRKSDAKRLIAVVIRSLKNSTVSEAEAKEAKELVLAIQAGISEPHLTGVLRDAIRSLDGELLFPVQTRAALTHFKSFFVLVDNYQGISATA